MSFEVNYISEEREGMKYIRIAVVHVKVHIRDSTSGKKVLKCTVVFRLRGCLLWHTLAVRHYS